MSESIKFHNTGRSVFLTWDTLDQICNQFINDFFKETHKDNKLCIECARDEFEGYITVKGLNKNDKAKWCELFNIYDSEENFDTESLFSENGYESIIPGSMLMSILTKIFSENEDITPDEYIDFKPKLSIANLYGVLFCENAPTDCTHWFITI